MNPRTHRPPFVRQHGCVLTVTLESLSVIELDLRATTETYASL